MLSILDFVNEKMELFKQAIGVLKRGGTNSEIQQIFAAKKGQAMPDFLDMDDDFLEMPDVNPLENLEKFESGHMAERVKNKNVYEE